MAYKNSIKALLKERGTLLIDGAMGTILMEESKEKNVPSEMLNIVSPETIIDVHTQYIDAGCDIITSNTFGANEAKIKEKLYNASIEEIVTAGINCAKSAVTSGLNDRDVKIALNIGAIGQIIGMMSDLNHKDAIKMFTRQVKAGVAAGADMVLIETMSDLEEMRDAITAVKENSDVPVLCSMSFNENGWTFMGVSPKAIAELANDMEIDAVGANCSLIPEQMYPIVEEILANTNIPVLAQPNAGLPVLVDGIVTYDTNVEKYSMGVCGMINKGVSIVGGCCGTSPQFISFLRKSIEKRG